MKKPTTVKELCEFIWKLEEKYNLLDFEIECVKPWQAHRIEIYYEMGKSYGVFEKELQRNLTFYEKCKGLVPVIYNSIIKNPLFGLKKVDTLIFTHPRSKLLNDKYVDIYTKYFIDECKSRDITYIEFEEYFNGKHIRDCDNHKKYLDFLTLYRNIYRKFINIKLSTFQIETINALSKDINQYSEFKIDISAILLRRTKNFIATYKIYKYIFSVTKPEKIYLVVSYGRTELIKAAKDLHIETIEFQHGTFSKYHLGYSYPMKNTLDYFPDKFLFWNEYWKSLIDFPLNESNKDLYSFKYLEEEKSKYTNIKKEKNKMVVLCQGGLTNRIAKKMLENIERFNNYTIIFKLHPEEYGKSDLYNYLMQLKSILNIDIVENVNLYEILAMSEYQVGVFSTALYEGIEFHCKTILFDLPGIEYMDKFIKTYKVEII